MGRDSHRDLTGVPNERILSNLSRLGDYGVPVEIRMPIIPGINDGRKEIEDTAQFLQDMRAITRVVLLPYHKLGEAKYARLDREAYRLTDPASRRRSPAGDSRMGASLWSERLCGLSGHA